MKKTPFILALLCGAASLASAATFHTPVSVTATNSTAYFAVANLHQGPGVGYSATSPHDGFINTPANTWVTDAPGGFPSDYLAIMPAPILVIDLGANFFLTEISTWGYTTSNANGASAFNLRFATGAEGTGGFGSSIPNQGGFTAAFSDVTRDSHTLTPLTARFVEMTITDNYYSGGGLGPPAGGDRVGLGEIAFEAIPEPSTALLGGVALLGLIRRRRA